MKSTSTTGPARSARPANPERGAARLLLVAAGLILLAGALLHNTWTVRLAVRAAGAIFHRPVALPPPDLIHRAQLHYLAAGALVLAAAWLAGRIGPVARLLRRPLFEKLTLSLVVIALPLAWLEIGLRPFVPPHEKTTTIFIKDDALGWKLRPNATDEWGGVTVHINERGFRGPVVPYERTGDARRVLYLGDSVTFGYTIARWEDTWPFLLADSLRARDAMPVETVNLAVEGYSQWQEFYLLENEGIKYAPDLVVVGFVLNDVTEMFHLARFGGSDEGFQLRHAYTSRVEKLLSKSALVYELQNVIREVKARRRLGEDLRLGAIRQEQLEVETLMKSPDQANVRAAWDVALADLQRIANWCAAREIPMLLVVFPFTVQLDDPAGLGAPQRVLDAYARQHAITSVDLLPLLAQHSRDTQTPPSRLFVDHDHLSAEGHRVVAGLLAESVAGILNSR